MTIGGGLGKLTKLAQGAIDLHSGRSQVDFAALAKALDTEWIAEARTVLEVHQKLGAPLVEWIARAAREKAQAMVPESQVQIIAVDRQGLIVGRA